MTQLKCSAQTCMYNEDRYCSKGDIMVEGKEAKEPSATSCGSFRERMGERGANSMDHPSKMIEVDCEAENCVFNEDCKCAAQEIGIAGAHACNCEDTECSSFECRC